MLLADFGTTRAYVGEDSIGLAYDHGAATYVFCDLGGGGIADGVTVDTTATEIGALLASQGTPVVTLKTATGGTAVVDAARISALVIGSADVTTVHVFTGRGAQQVEASLPFDKVRKQVEAALASAGIDEVMIPVGDGLTYLPLSELVAVSARDGSEKPTVQFSARAFNYDGHSPEDIGRVVALRRGMGMDLADVGTDTVKVFADAHRVLYITEQCGGHHDRSTIYLSRGDGDAAHGLASPLTASEATARLAAVEPPSLEGVA